jgi:3-isopropylmalate dehydrogenase
LGDSSGAIGLYEPIHGSAPDIAGRDMANPVGCILSAAMMLRHSLGLDDEAAAVEGAVDTVLASGARTADLGGGESTTDIGRKVVEALAG